MLSDILYEANEQSKNKLKQSLDKIINVEISVLNNSILYQERLMIFLLDIFFLKYLIMFQRKILKW
jgi:hypothetical protein